MLRLLLLATVISGWVGSGVIQSNDIATPTSGSDDTFETVTILFTMDATNDHLEPIHNTVLAAADLVVDLTGVSGFAYGHLSMFDDEGYYNQDFGRYKVPKRLTTNPIVSLDIRLNEPDENLVAEDRCIPLFRIPFGDYIPDNSTIVSATVYPWFHGTAYYAKGDTAMAVLMTNPNDNKWYTSKGITNDYPNYAHVSWNNQISSRNSDPNWAAGNSEPWNPTLVNREYYWDMGDYWDWTGGTATGSTSDVAQPISILNCVQAVVNGAVNNGIALLGGDRNVVNQDWDIYVWDERSQNVNKSAFVVVKYITKSYQLPFGGNSVWAFVATTDDGREIPNTAYVGVAADHGGKITICVVKNYIDGGGVVAGLDSLTYWHDVNGMEIATHSVVHSPPFGLLAEQASDSTQVEYANMRAEITPEWLYDMADTFDGNERRDSPYWAKSMAMPNNRWGPEVLRLLADMRYVQARVGSAAGPVSHGDYDAGFFAIDQGINFSRVDSLFSGASHPDQRKPRNMMGLPVTMTVIPIVGSKDNTTITEAQVKHNMKRAIAHIIGDGRGVLSLFWHDFKSGGFPEGVDEDEFDWMADVVDEMNGRWMRLSEYGRWIQTYATPIDRPAALDTFNFLEADNVWFKADGVDQTWIRGVK